LWNFAFEMAAHNPNQQTDLARQYGGGLRYYHCGITPIAEEYPQTLSNAKKEEWKALAVHQKRITRIQPHVYLGSSR
jgi:hypothetical protein